MYKVLGIDVDTHIVIYSLICTNSKAVIKAKVSRYELNYTKEKILKGDLVTIGRMYFQKLNEYEAKNIKKVNLS